MASDTDSFLHHLCPQQEWGTILKKLKDGQSPREIGGVTISPQLVSLGVAFLMATQSSEWTAEWLRKQAEKMVVFTDMPDTLSRLQKAFYQAACLTNVQDSQSQLALFDDLSEQKCDVFLTRRVAVRNKKAQQKDPNTVVMSERAHQYVESCLRASDQSVIARLTKVYQSPFILHAKNSSSIQSGCVLDFSDFMEQLSDLLRASGQQPISIGYRGVMAIIQKALDKNGDGCHDVMGIKMDLGAMHDPKNIGKVVLVDLPQKGPALTSDLSEIVVRSLCRVAPNATMNDVIVPHYPKELEGQHYGRLKRCFDQSFNLSGGKSALVYAALQGSALAASAGEFQISLSS